MAATMKKRSELAAEHTQGPWQVESDYSADGCDLIVLAEQCYVVADCRGGEFGVDSPEEAEANARLISAAPDLLAACKAIAMRYKIRDAIGDGAWEMLASAIQKADGN